MADEKLPTTTIATTSSQKDGQPPAYSSPIPPTTQQQASPPQERQQQEQQEQPSPDLPASQPPPQYKPKRTPSQEAIYMSELKAWAAEKEKMYEGAYGEYFGKIIDPDRVPRWRWDEWHRLGGDASGGRSSGGIGAGPGAAGGEAKATAERRQSRRERDEATDRELRELRVPLRRLSVGEPSSSRDGTAAAESTSAPKEGSVKKRMSSFINKIRKHEVEAEPGDREEALRARDELVAQELARQRRQS